MNLQQALAAITNLERSERIKRGLPPDHILSWDEFPFAFAKDQVRQLGSQLAALPNVEFAAIDAFLKALQGDLIGADESLRRFQAAFPDNALARIRFVEPLAMPAETPRVVGHWPRTSSLFICCDPRYLDLFARPLLRSLAEHAPALRAHVHIMAGGPIAPLGPNITSTYDLSAPQAPEYYHAARFVYFAEALEHAPALVMADADSLVTGDPSHLLESADAGLRIRPGRVEPWNQFSGCLVRGTAKSRPYYREVSTIIRTLLDRPFWGLDQYALYAAALRMRPNIALFGPHIASVTADAPGLFWFTAGTQKDSLATANSPFAERYRTYR